tara:strand:- start:3333 stop:3968 length:636 start_codon:yes stop_codon:yes gene_type:complete
MIKLKDILREVGEANIKPSAWSKTAGETPQQFKSNMNNPALEVDLYGHDTINVYEFTTDKGTRYRVDIQIEYYMQKVGINENPQLEAEVDFTTVDDQSVAQAMTATNLHEQYAVMSTVTDIVISWLNEWDKTLYFNSIKIDPIDDEIKDFDPLNRRTQNKRGKLYHAYLQKQLSKLNKQYQIQIKHNVFFIVPTYPKPGNVEYDFTGIVDK